MNNPSPPAAPSVSIVVAAAENHAIGRRGDLPWRLPADLKRFKQLTMGGSLIMGRKTYESHPRPLPGRTSIVLTSSPEQVSVPEDLKEGTNVLTAASLDEAIAQANATKYGLAASIFTKDQNAIDRFRREARAGCVNVNCGTAGASSKLPFGGLGWSGNHRPAGSFCLDYCAYPVAGMRESGDDATIAQGMTVDPAWLA